MSRRNRMALAAALVAGGALGVAGQAAADPAVPDPTVPTPGTPPTPTLTVIQGDPAAAAAAPAPGQLVMGSGNLSVAPAPPPPVGTRTVPEIQNPQYGSGQSSGPLGTLRDLWHAAHSDDPMGALASPADVAPGPPPGAGPPPPLPPGYISLTAPRPAT
ncbi:MAG TPA: hypothetical protein PKM47_15425, partial [Mycobacterium sp.]|nr:hypothetical protein [Mycobacterium sp.]